MVRKFLYPDPAGDQLLSQGVWIDYPYLSLHKYLRECRGSPDRVLVWSSRGILLTMDLNSRDLFHFICKGSLLSRSVFFIVIY